MLGRSGSALLRVALLTPSARSFPARTWGKIRPMAGFISYDGDGQVTLGNALLKSGAQPACLGRCREGSLKPGLYKPAPGSKFRLVSSGFRLPRSGFRVPGSGLEL